MSEERKKLFEHEDEKEIHAQTFFTKMVDELVEFSEHDPQRADGLRWLDGQAQKKGKTFYEMVYQILYKHDINAKAKKWLEDKN